MSTYQRDTVAVRPERGPEWTMCLERLSGRRISTPSSLYRHSRTFCWCIRPSEVNHELSLCIFEGPVVEKVKRFYRVALPEKR